MATPWSGRDIEEQNAERYAETLRAVATIDFRNLQQCSDPRCPFHGREAK